MVQYRNPNLKIGDSIRVFNYLTKGLKQFLWLEGVVTNITKSNSCRNKYFMPCKGFCVNVTNRERGQITCCGLLIKKIKEGEGDDI